MSNSIYAHKTTIIESQEEPSLNIIDDEWIVEKLDTRYLDSDGKGILIIEKEKIKKLISKLKKEKKMFNEDKEMYLNKLQILLNDCGEDDVCLYYCY